MHKEHHAKFFHVQWDLSDQYLTLTLENILNFVNVKHLQNQTAFPPVKDILIC